MGVILAIVGGFAAWAGRHQIGVSPILAGLLCASCFLRRRDAVIAGLGAVLVHDALVGFSLFTLVRLIGVSGALGVIWAVRVRPSFPEILLRKISQDGNVEGPTRDRPGSSEHVGEGVVGGSLNVIRLNKIPRPWLGDCISLLLGIGLSSFTYHVFLALGDWATQTCSTAPLTPQGLVTSMASSMPYLQRSLIGETAFTGAFLALYTLAGYLVALRWPKALTFSQL